MCHGSSSRQHPWWFCRRIQVLVRRFKANMAIWKRLQKNLTITFGLNARIEDYHCPVIPTGSNESTKSCRSDCIEPRFMHGFTGYSEGQFRDNHIHQRITRHINSLPEAVGAQQHTPRFAYETFKHLGSWQAIGLVEQTQLALS